MLVAMALVGLVLGSVLLVALLSAAIGFGFHVGWAMF